MNKRVLMVVFVIVVLLVYTGVFFMGHDEPSIVYEQEITPVEFDLTAWLNGGR